MIRTSIKNNHIYTYTIFYIQLHYHSKFSRIFIITTNSRIKSSLIIIKGELIEVYTNKRILYIIAYIIHTHLFIQYKISHIIQTIKFLPTSSHYNKSVQRLQQRREYTIFFFFQIFLTHTKQYETKKKPTQNQN